MAGLYSTKQDEDGRTAEGCNSNGWVRPFCRKEKDHEKGFSFIDSWAGVFPSLAFNAEREQHVIIRDGYTVPDGKMLLIDAIKRTLDVSNEIAIYAIVVDAIDEQAECFYQQYGFSPLSSEGRRLFLPLKSF